MGFWDSVTHILEKQFVDRALNLSGQHRDFFCDHCQRITDHISISHATSLARVNQQEAGTMRLVSRVVGKLNDLNPVQNLLLGRPYRCGTCGRERLD